MFLSQFIKPPDDYVSVVAYDMRPTPLTDFTNDPRRINEVVNLLLRNTPAFRESNLFDALKFVLIGGRGDSVVLEDSKSEKSDYSGLVTVQGRRRALILISSGLDTYNKINYGDARKIAQNAGIPIYILGQAPFTKIWRPLRQPMHYRDAGKVTADSSRQNTLKTFAKKRETYFPYTLKVRFPTY